MTERVWIEGKLPSANEYINACRLNPHAGNKLKKETELLIMWQISKLSPIDKPARFHFEWHEKNRRRDKDNVSFGQKFVFDALQKAGKLPNDNNKFVIGFEHDFIYGIDQGLYLTITEINETEEQT